ncbi:MAG: 23S rRNA (cytidine(2498)-2'-O)-methyltransferase RlmM, partial [Magnetococcales bacterium]|nr:23S rRNA (cytidine(2498)-2'-O)-methyltransferase RlmM [Magnetococcales bacterium]
MFALCRNGFEQECLNELTLAIPGSVETTRGDGYVYWRLQSPNDGDILLQKVTFSRLVFTRHLLAVDAELPHLSPQDRITPLSEALEILAQRIGAFSDLWLGWPDSDEGRVLAPLAKALRPRLAERLRTRHLLDPDQGGGRAEVIFLSSCRALTGYSLPYNSSRFPMGIPRLRSPVAAPSRSALKLEEALDWFNFLWKDLPSAPQPGQTVVDLGAAPGGWSWVMAQRGVKVTAVDRADLADHVRVSPLVKHVRENGFHYRPHILPDWLLCDIVDQPRQVASLIARWGTHGWCRNAIFNLKLPMKKRSEEIKLCRQSIAGTLTQHR